MDTPSINIYFDYGGHYTKSEDGYEWHPDNSEASFGISFKASSIADITYAELVGRICKKVGVDECKTRLRLSFIPLIVRPRKHIAIRDDEDVYLYLTSLDSEQRRSYLNVEVVKEVEMCPLTENVSLRERRSSHGGNYGELRSSGRQNVGASPGVASVFTGNHLAILPRQLTESTDNDGNDYGDEVSQDDVSQDDVSQDDVSQDDVSQDDVHSGYDNNVDNIVDDGTEEVGIGEYDELPRVVERIESVEEWEDGMNVEKGREFESKQAVKDLVERAMHQNCFGTVLVNSDTKRYVVKCSEAGNGCKWYFRATKVNESSRFSVKTYNKMHTCSRTSSSTLKKKRGTPGLVASILKEDYPGKYETPTPNSIIGLVQGRVGVEVSYSTALRGKKKAVDAVRGSPEEGYKNVFSYLHMLEKVNPGTKTRVLLDDEKRFRYLFIALGACIQGFQAMRKVIIVDATFLKSLHGGTLIFATAQDPNRHIYPVAFAIVDGENDASWKWFFETLKTVVPDSSELVFTSDRNPSLIKAIGEVYPNSHHGYCLYHLSQNVKLRAPHANKDEIVQKFMAIGHIYTEVEFLKEYAEFRSRFPTVATYLDGSVEEKKWARCYFPGERYNIDTTNCAESLNGIFVNKRKYSLLPLIDAIIEKIAEWFNQHRKDASEVPLTRKLVPDVENLLHGRCEEGKKLTVVELNAFELEYSVLGRDGKTYVVDLRHKTCACKRFDIDKYPCVHAIAATFKYLKQDIRPMDLESLYELCSPYYMVHHWSLMYSITVFPVPYSDHWDIPEDVKKLFALPPNYKKRKGRRQERRKPSIGERRRRNKLVTNRNLASYFECGPQEES